MAARAGPNFFQLQIERQQSPAPSAQSSPANTTFPEHLATSPDSFVMTLQVGLGLGAIPIAVAPFSALTPSAAVTTMRCRSKALRS
jgi:hypothetical protein